MMGTATLHIEEAIRLRRELHRHPEPAWEEAATARLVRHHLDKAGIPWRPCAQTGTVAVLAPDAPGRHVALRADIDALPIREASGVAWTSQRDGFMHACGHDGHTATLLAAAWTLKDRETELPGPVTLLFQPAEEGGHGALRMIQDGAMEGVDIIYGWHNWPSIPYGKAVCPDGPVMAANAVFRISIQGEGGHASQPESCRDPVLAAAATAIALQQIVSRRLAPQQAAVVSVSSIDAASAEIIIPDRTTVAGSIRLADHTLLPQLEALITDIATHTCQAYGVTAAVEVRPAYPATANHAGAAEELRSALASEFGPEWQYHNLLLPIMASEDFSYYLQHVPGAFALIGANDGPQHAAACHNPRYDFNDRLISRVAPIFLRLAGLSPGE